MSDQEKPKFTPDPGTIAEGTQDTVSIYYVDEAFIRSEWEDGRIVVVDGHTVASERDLAHIKTLGYPSEKPALPDPPVGPDQGLPGGVRPIGPEEGRPVRPDNSLPEGRPDRPEHGLPPEGSGPPPGVPSHPDGGVGDPSPKGKGK